MLPNSTISLSNSVISYTSNGVIVLDALFLDCMLLGCYFIASSDIKKTKTSQIIHCPKLFTKIKRKLSYSNFVILIKILMLLVAGIWAFYVSSEWTEKLFLEN